MRSKVKRKRKSKSKSKSKSKRKSNKLNDWLAAAGYHISPATGLNHGSLWNFILGCVVPRPLFFADFGRFSVIFGPKLAVFTFFDEEKKVRFLSGFFLLGLWLAAH